MAAAYGAQTQHAHGSMALGRGILARRLPDVHAELLTAGAQEFLLRDDVPGGAAVDRR